MLLLCYRKKQTALRLYARVAHVHRDGAVAANRINLTLVLFGERQDNLQPLPLKQLQLQEFNISIHFFVLCVLQCAPVDAAF
jgi:hypothetical protein